MPQNDAANPSERTHTGLTFNFYTLNTAIVCTRDLQSFEEQRFVRTETTNGKKENPFTLNYLLYFSKAVGYKKKQRPEK